MDRNGGRSLLREGRTYVPLRSVANLLGARVDFVDWDTRAGGVKQYNTGPRKNLLVFGCSSVNSESKGESLLGQIAVGNVILNRAASGQFPNTVKGVVFDRKNGVQFEPASP